MQPAQALESVETSLGWRPLESKRHLRMLPSDNLPPSTLPSLLTRLYGATELHNDSMGVNEDHESGLRVVNIRSHAQMIYSISVTVYMSSFPVVCLCLQPLEDSVRALMAIPKQGMPKWRPHALER